MARGGEHFMRDDEINAPETPRHMRRFRCIKRIL